VEAERDQVKLVVLASNPGHLHKTNTMPLLSTDHQLIPAECKRPHCSKTGVQSMQVDGRLPIGK
jgi:hypothetical protein